jgi:hypothetical protein
VPSSCVSTIFNQTFLLSLDTVSPSAVTGHHLVETVMRHYAKLKGVDAKHELMSAMPKSITEHPGQPSQEEPTAVSKLAEQAKRLSPEDRAELKKLL